MQVLPPIVLALVRSTVQQIERSWPGVPIDPEKAASDLDSYIIGQGCRISNPSLDDLADFRSHVPSGPFAPVATILCVTLFHILDPPLESPCILPRAF